jgi:endogenous inhibitor of DNA gyrase (YacG/DUF329 family)
MSRPFKPNQTPVAPFNLRLTGPMKVADLQKRVGKGFRIAQAHGDQRATVDHDACPHCGMPVEWAPTSTTEKGKTVQYIYARCQGVQKHAWGFSNHATKRDIENGMTITDTTPLPRPSAGSVAMAMWIDKKAVELEAQVKALQELRRLTAVLGPIPSPQLPIPPNGDPTPPHRGR